MAGGDDVPRRWPRRSTDRRRPGPQPRHDRRLDRPRRPGVGLPGDRARVRGLRGAPRSRRRAGRPARRLLRGSVPDRDPARTRSSSRSAAGRSRRAPGSPTAKLAQPASGYSIVGIAAVVVTSGGTITHAAIGVTGVHEHAYRAEDVESALDRLRRVGRRRSRRPRPTSPTASRSTRTSTPTPSTGRRWPSSTRVARSRPPSAGRPGSPIRRVRVERIQPGSRPRRTASPGPSSRATCGSAASAGRRAGGSRRADLDGAGGRRRRRSPLTASRCSSSRPATSTRTTRRCGSRRPSATTALTVRGPSESRVDLLATVRRRAVRPDAGSWSGSTGSTRSRCSPRSTARSSGRRPRRERQGRAARRRRGGGRRPASGCARRPPAGRPRRAVPAAAGRGRRQGGGPVAWPGERFEASVRAKVETLGSEIVSIVYARDGRRRRGGAAARLARPRPGRRRADGGRRQHRPAGPVLRRDRRARRARSSGTACPSHPGSMVWLGRIGRTAVLGLPTCGAYSKATAADLLLPRLLTGERPSPPPSRRSATAGS